MARIFRTVLLVWPAGVVVPLFWCGQVTKGYQFGGLEIPSPLFADDMYLLASLNSNLQLALGHFAAECEAGAMKINTSKSEALAFSLRIVHCPLRFGKEFLPQIEELKYLGVSFVTEGKMGVGD